MHWNHARCGCGAIVRLPNIKTRNARCDDCCRKDPQNTHAVLQRVAENLSKKFESTRDRALRELNDKPLPRQATSEDEIRAHLQAGGWIAYARKHNGEPVTHPIIRRMLANGEMRKRWHDETWWAFAPNMITAHVDQYDLIPAGDL